MEASRTIESKVASTFGKRAAGYDHGMTLYYLIGYRYHAYRKHAVRALELRPGDTVVEIGCGTGINFAAVQKTIGPTGKIIGVDRTDSMLAEAHKKVKAAGWSNVELVQCDAVEYEFPESVDGVLSTYALSYIPRFEEIVVKGCKALAPGRRLSILDLKSPAYHSVLSKIVSYLLVLFLRPYAVTDDYIARRRLEETKTVIYKNLEDTYIREWYLGTTYVISGRCPNPTD